jgi:eukaryotic-like serine/threonine-protein kinase
MNKSLDFLFLLIIFLSACGSAPVTTAPLATPTDFPTVTTAPSPTSTLEPTATITPLPGIGSTRISAVDGMMLVYIPEGSFTMGYEGADDEKPVHDVFLSSFWMDQTEVTNAMYARCVEAGACSRPISIASYSHSDYYNNPQYSDFPVISVSWFDAGAYCTWAGRRLPTEAEWEKAARGTDERLYPWGNESPVCALANFVSPSGVCAGDPATVGSYPAGASPYAVLDMAGNVLEWVSDIYGPSYYFKSPDANPIGPEIGAYRGLRGGSWYSDESALRVTNRSGNNPNDSFNTVGFRCAQDATP